MCVHEWKLGVENNLCLHANVFIAQLGVVIFIPIAFFACFYFLGTDGAYLCQMLFCIFTSVRVCVCVPRSSSPRSSVSLGV